MGELHERGRPVINHELKPVTAGAPTCITRGAGMDFDPPACDGDLWPLALFYLLVYLGYAIGYCFYKLGEQIWEACNAPDAEEEKAAPAETQPEPQAK